MDSGGTAVDGVKGDADTTTKKPHSDAVDDGEPNDSDELSSSEEVLSDLPLIRADL